jgi:2-(1,2-epoxy-1,2-dihydrophenyl)acetyl-CoA isomerase
MSTVSTSLDNGVLTITLNRPEQGNALDMAMAQDLLAAVQAAAADSAVRCVVLTGAGRMFCVGGDVGAFAAAGDDAGTFIRTLADKAHESVMILAGMDKPLVALVNGPAAGVGLSLAIAADIVIASEAANFTAAYTAIGLTPDGGMTWLLPRLVGMRAAQDMILTNRRVAAVEARELGLVTRVVAAEQLAEEGARLAGQLAAGPTAALGAARRLLAGAQMVSLAAQLDSEAASISAHADSAEGREGVAAFMARRKPNFRSV